jgi:hypothetical protein
MCLLSGGASSLVKLFHGWSEGRMEAAPTTPDYCAWETRETSNQFGGGKSSTPGEGIVVLCTSPRRLPFSGHGGKNVEAEG